MTHHYPTKAEYAAAKVRLPVAPFEIELDRDAARPYDRRSSLNPVLDRTLPNGPQRAEAFKKLLREVCK